MFLLDVWKSYIIRKKIDVPYTLSILFSNPDAKFPHIDCLLNLQPPKGGKDLFKIKPGVNSYLSYEIYGSVKMFSHTFHLRSLNLARVKCILWANIINTI